MPGGAGKSARAGRPDATAPPDVPSTVSTAGATLLGPGPNKAAPGAIAAPPETAEPAHALIPRWLYTGGAWSWRLIVIGIVAYYVLRFLLKIQLVVVPFLGAMVFTALLRPLAQRLQRNGFSRLMATWTTFLISLIVVLGLGTLVVYRSIAEWHVLINDLSDTTAKLRHWLSGPPFHLKNTDLKDLQQKQNAHHVAINCLESSNNKSLE